ncbi:DUF4230 domain-containing protein [Candidatus Uhrbacteria bacterium]|nr:DUF4230 domain-containing protein [Candidatus Uhrbacteria bacterium]
MKKALWIAVGGAVLASILFALGILVGYKTFSPKPEMKTEISSQAILTALHDRGFLVTQTFMFDQPVVIKKTTGSALKDFFFGQTITARGTMEVNTGLDFAKVTQEDVLIEGDTIKVKIPRSSLFNTRLVGPLEVNNEKGILKRLTDSDNGYNESLQILTQEAEKAAKQPELVERADLRAKEDATRILGYVAQGKTIVVEFK